MNRLSLFGGIGLELETMIVEIETLAILPIADQLLSAAAGQPTCFLEHGDLSWSNELALHVLELKTNGPTTSMAAAAAAFVRDLRLIDSLLAPLGARLMPTAMHPWMDPRTETHLWPHEFSPVYEAFDRVFDCRGHGWSNLQSLHLNLPFCGDDEFGRLHAATRLLLPLLPALAASSPVVEGRTTGLLDNRLGFYGQSSRRQPLVAGDVVPEPVFAEADYRREILEPMWDALAADDPRGILRHEWLNGRGATPRFSRGSLEIRLLDVQECPRADCAIALVVSAVLAALVAERWSSTEEQRRWPVAPLAELLRATTSRGEATLIDDQAYLAAFGCTDSCPTTAGKLWRHLASEVWNGSIPLPFGGDPTGELGEALEVLLREGPLARRLLRVLGPDPDRETLRHTYTRLCDCLVEDRLFEAPP